MKKSEVKRITRSRSRDSSVGLEDGGNGSNLNATEKLKENVKCSKSKKGATRRDLKENIMGSTQMSSKKKLTKLVNDKSCKNRTKKFNSQKEQNSDVETRSKRIKPKNTEPPAAAEGNCVKPAETELINSKDNKTLSKKRKLADLAKFAHDSSYISPKKPKFAVSDEESKQSPYFAEKIPASQSSKTEVSKRGKKDAKKIESSRVEKPRNSKAKKEQKLEDYSTQGGNQTAKKSQYFIENTKEPTSQTPTSKAKGSKSKKVVKRSTEQHKEPSIRKKQTSQAASNKSGAGLPNAALLSSSTTHDSVLSMLSQFENCVAQPSTSASLTKDKIARKSSKKKEVQSSDSEESDWEEVADIPVEPQKDSPIKAVEITVDAPDPFGKAKKQCDNEATWLRWCINRYQKNIQETMHKVHLLLLMARGMYINKVCMDEYLKALSLSCIPLSLKCNQVASDVNHLNRLMKWFRAQLQTAQNTYASKSLPEMLESRFQDFNIATKEEKVMMFVCMLRALGVDTRLVYSLQPITFKQQVRVTVKDGKVVSASKNDKPTTKKTAVKKTTSKVKKRRDTSESDDSDGDFEIAKIPTIHKKQTEIKVTGLDLWIEIYLKSSKKWIAVDIVHDTRNEPYAIEKHASLPLSYVLAFDNYNHVKDVTKRYANDWLTHNRKLRVDETWWTISLQPFASTNVEREQQEDLRIHEMLLQKPLPKTIAQCKGHPLYAVKSHLLKFEALYPENAIPVGYIKGEPVYARECVHELHSRECWPNEARSVRVDEKPYKIVKGKKKKHHIAGGIDEVPSIELYGRWQTEPYMPGIAHDGKVPRNAFGNVEMFKDCMLPQGCVHIKLPNLMRIANKLNIDCALALVGFEFKKGFNVPKHDGYIVCEEFKDTLIAAWEEDQRNQEKKREEQREKRVIKNWRQLVKSLLIRERLKQTYLSKGTYMETSECEKSSDKSQETKISEAQVAWPQSLGTEAHVHVLPK